MCWRCQQPHALVYRLVVIFWSHDRKTCQLVALVVAKNVFSVLVDVPGREILLNALGPRANVMIFWDL